jgi:hypothetical protein
LPAARSQAAPRPLFLTIVQAVIAQVPETSHRLYPQALAPDDQAREEGPMSDAQDNLVNDPVILADLVSQAIDPVI